MASVRRATVITLAAVALALTTGATAGASRGAAAPGAPLRPPCGQTPDPLRWGAASPPDAGRRDPVISAHRGALALAPENTLWSYEYAFAYGVDLVEVDVQQTRDGRFVALHDATVDRTTDGTGPVAALTYAEVRALNAADYEPWTGTEFDPAQVASVEEVLALAARVGGGLELDVKGSVTEEGRLAELVREHGLIEESIFNSSDPRILAVAPEANLIYNRDAFEPPVLLHGLARAYAVFGSRLDEYTAEAVAAIHDACAIVMPHAYDAGAEQEVAQFRRARAIGADGVQTNQPDAIVAAAGRPAASRLAAARRRVCLLDARHGLGFPAKPLELRKGEATMSLTTGLGGCRDVPPGWRRARVSFAGDGSVQPASARLP